MPAASIRSRFSVSRWQEQARACFRPSSASSTHPVPPHRSHAAFSVAMKTILILGKARLDEHPALARPFEVSLQVAEPLLPARARFPAEDLVGGAGVGYPLLHRDEARPLPLDEREVDREALERFIRPALIRNVANGEPPSGLVRLDLAHQSGLGAAAFVGEPERPVAAGAPADERAFAPPREKLGDPGERVESVRRARFDRHRADDVLRHGRDGNAATGPPIAVPYTPRS